MEERGFVLMSRQLKCIGILCMLFVAAVNSCPDNGTMDCDILPTDGLTCSYVKGSPTEEPTYSLDVPTKVKNLRVTPGFASDSKGGCESRLNITWTVSADGSLKYLRGFFLVASFYYYVDGTDRVVYRTFTVNATGTEQLYQTVFVHDCMVPIEKTLYHVELFSLPQNYQERNHATAEIRTANTVAAHNQCDRTGDPRYTYNWTSTMWTSANPSNASIEVCFYTAPPSFNFTSYLIYLLPNKNDPMNMFIELKNVTVDPLKTTPVCEQFINVCPGDYKIHVTPDNNPVGTCHNGDEQASCTATVVDSINMTESVCIATVSARTSTTTALSTSKVPSTTGSGGGTDPGKIVGIVIGVVAAVILIVVLAAGICLFRRRSYPEKRNPFPPKDGPGSDEAPSFPIDNQQTVLLVYSSDNEHHRKVVRTFAAFLHSCCKCDVRFDDWSQVDISQTNALDWLTKQLHQVKHIIFINSLGAFMQHKAWIEGATCQPVKELLLPDMFIPALRQIQAKVYDKPPNKLLQYYHVYFPYTDVKHLLDVSFGQRYKLMKHIEDLFLNIHGMTKYSGKGLTSACQINEKGYACSAEGQAFQSAVDDAIAYYKRNPDWFHGCFNCGDVNKESEGVTLVDFRPAHGDGQPMTVNASIESDSSRPSSFSSADRNNVTISKSSDEGYPEMVPPSSSSSSSSIDMESRRSVSIDVGFGDTLDNYSTFDPNSPSVQLGFCPPIPDDDETSIGSHMFFDKLNELNEQYDSGIPFSSFELQPSGRSSC